MTAAGYISQLRAYTFAVRAYGMTETMADRADDRQDWLGELGKCAVKARDAALALADHDATSAAGMGWREEAAYWDRLVPKLGARRGDIMAGAFALRATPL